MAGLVPAIHVLGSVQKAWIPGTRLGMTEEIRGMMASDAGTQHDRDPPLQPDDREAWEPLWQGYLTFYKSSLPAEVTETTWRRLLDPAEPMHGLAAVLDGADRRHRPLHLSPLHLDDGRLLLPAGSVHGGRGARARRRPGSDRGGLREGESGRREPGLLADPRDQHDRQALYDKVAARSGFIQYRQLF